MIILRKQPKNKQTQSVTVISSLYPHSPLQRGGRWGSGRWATNEAAAFQSAALEVDRSSRRADVASPGIRQQRHRCCEELRASYYKYTFYIPSSLLWLKSNEHCHYINLVNCLAGSDSVKCHWKTNTISTSLSVPSLHCRGGENVRHSEGREYFIWRYFVWSGSFGSQ